MAQGSGEEMSASICRRCFALFRDGQRVSFVGSAAYHIIKSSVHYAIDPKTMDIDDDTLVHSSQEDCEYDDTEN